MALSTLQLIFCTFVVSLALHTHAFNTFSYKYRHHSIPLSSRYYRHSSRCSMGYGTMPESLTGGAEQPAPQPTAVDTIEAEMLEPDEEQGPIDFEDFDDFSDVLSDDQIADEARPDDTILTSTPVASNVPIRQKAKLPVVAVVGRPNVGKSTIVNRLAGQFTSGSIVNDESGVTRDRTYRPATWQGYNFQVVDTGGLVYDDDASHLFMKHIREQAEIALSEANVVVQVVDGMEGLSHMDADIASFLRGRGIKTLLAVNKCENPLTADLNCADFWSLGLGDPFPVSGIHGSGTGELLDEVVKDMYLVDEVETEKSVRVAVVGRPNVGKSSILNRLCGDTRSIVSELAGTTRDTVDTTVTEGDQVFHLVDTAGVRRKKKVVGQLRKNQAVSTEFLMINRAFKAIRRCDVAVLVVDASQDFADQDRKIAERIVDEGRACVVVVNKWDSIEKDDSTFNKKRKEVLETLSCVKWSKVLFTSALTGQRIDKLLPLCKEAAEQHSRRVSTAVLNEVLLDAIRWQGPHSNHQGKQGRVYYAAQVASRPPTIVVFCNNPSLFGEGYKRYLERKFRESLGFDGCPVRVFWKGKKGDRDRL